MTLETISQGHLEALELNQLISHPSNVGLMDKARRADTILIDMDDTLPLYSRDVSVLTMYETLGSFVTGFTKEGLMGEATKLHDLTNYMDLQDEVVGGLIGAVNVRNFWGAHSSKFKENITDKHIKFDERLVRYLGKAIGSGLTVGIISNASPETGSRILDMVQDMTKLDFNNQAVFLGKDDRRKPNEGALAAFGEHTGLQIESDKMLYIGNATSDMEFASKVRATGIWTDYYGTHGKVKISPETSSLLARSLITKGEIFDQLALAA